MPTEENSRAYTETENETVKPLKWTKTESDSKAHTKTMNATASSSKRTATETLPHSECIPEEEETKTYKNNLN